MLKVILGKLSLITLVASFAVSFISTEAMAASKACVRKCQSIKNSKEKDSCYKDCNSKK